MTVMTGITGMTGMPKVTNLTKVKNTLKRITLFLLYPHIRAYKEIQNLLNPN